jgi:hypothetical protein
VRNVVGGNPRGDDVNLRSGPEMQEYDSIVTPYFEAIARLAGLYYHGAYEHDRLYDRVSSALAFRLKGRIVEKP